MSKTPTEDSRFSEFVLFQAQNAGLFLGCVPNPATGQVTVNMRAAKSVLDSLEMLEEKTEGNLAEKEVKLLERVLENVRRLYSEADAIGG